MRCVRGNSKGNSRRCRRVVGTGIFRGGAGGAGGVDVDSRQCWSQQEHEGSSRRQWRWDGWRAWAMGVGTWAAGCTYQRTIKRISFPAIGMPARCLPACLPVRRRLSTACSCASSARTRGGSWRDGCRAKANGSWAVTTALIESTNGMVRPLRGRRHRPAMGAPRGPCSQTQSACRGTKCKPKPPRARPVGKLPSSQRCRAEQPGPPQQQHRPPAAPPAKGAQRPQIQRPRRLSAGPSAWRAEHGAALGVSVYGRC